MAKKEQVGTVKVVVRAESGDNVVKRVPVYEGQDPAEVLAREQAKSGRNVEKAEKRQIETPKEHGVRPEPKAKK